MPENGGENGGEEGPLRRPDSPTQVFLAFQRLSLQGFGGVLAVAQRELVERQRWLTREEFLGLLALGQVLPGANVVNLSLLVGQRFFGGRGAAAALAGMLAAPLVIVLLLAALFGAASQQPAVSGALRGMGVVAAGMIGATAIKLGGTLGRSPLGWRWSLPLATGAFVAVGLLRWPLVGVVLGTGLMGIALAWRRLGR